MFVSNGQSPFSHQQKSRILNERIDALLTEARHLNVDPETVLHMVRQRKERFE